MEQTVGLQIERLEKGTDAGLKAEDAVALSEAGHQLNEPGGIEGRVSLGRYAPGSGWGRLGFRCWPSSGYCRFSQAR